MNEAKLESSPLKRGGWLRKLLWLGGVLVVLLVVAFFVVTSGAFVKAVVLPKVSAALNADLAVGDVQFSPFSQLVLRDVKLTPQGAEPLLTASLVRTRYDLFAILRGNIVVEEVTVESPTVTLVENADGTSNLDPLMKNQQPAAAQPAAKPSSPPQLDIKSIALKNATVKRTKNLKGGGRESLELANVNLTLANLKNGSTGKLDLSAAIALDNSASTNAASLAGKLTADFAFALTPDLKPGKLSGKAAFTVEKAGGSFADFNALAVTLDCEATPTEVKQLAVRFTQSGQALGEVRVSGPLDPAKLEGKLNIAILALDRRVLNLAGASSGIDFGTTTVNATNLVELAKGGSLIRVSGLLDAAKVRITRLNQTTPNLDLRCDYEITVDTAAKSAQLQRLNLSGAQDGRLLLATELPSPMTIPWGNASNTVGDATLNLTLTGLNLADWRAFAAELEPVGTANVEVKLLSQQGGQSLTFDLEASALGLSAKLGTNNTLTRADLRLRAHITSLQGGQNLNFDFGADVTALAAKFGPDTINPAAVTLQGRGTSQQNGKRLTFDLDAGVTGLTAKFGTNLLNPTDLTLRARGTGTDLKQFKLEELRAEIAQVAQGAQPAATVSGSGTFNSTTQDADLQIELRATLTRLLAMFPQPQANFTGGSLALNGRVTSTAKSQSVTGKLTLDGLTGRYGDYRFASFGSSADVNLAVTGDQLEIRQASGELHEGANTGGRFDVTGNFDTARKAGQFALKLADFNPNGLRPFLESALGDKKLVSIALNSTATVKLEANGDAAAKADLQISNLVVRDPKGSLPTTPLEMKAALDAGVAKSVAQVRQCQLTLTPTARAKNELHLTGTVDFSRTNATTGGLKLASDSLDVTQYYDLFAGGAKPATTPASTTTPAAAPPTDQEPGPMKLPFTNFTFEASVGKFYLREVEATNFQFTAKLDPGRVVIKPARFALNGAPVNAAADVDLSVTGYKYDVSFGAEPIPLAPLANSFVPERKGQFHGVTLANAKFKGAGITGASLRKNLTGDFSFASTNLNLAIPDLQSKLIKEVINVIVGIPELIRNPTAALGNMLGRLIGGGGGTKGGFTDELMSRPIDAIQVRGRAGEGKITLEQAEVRSPAFLASAAGVITLADILTNSAIRFPVRVSLSRPLADKVGLAGNTPTNQLMAALPDFLTMKGTVGKPEKDINAMALIAVVAKAGGGVAGQIGGATVEKVGGVLNLIGGLVGGSPQPQPGTTTTNAVKAATNAPASNVQTQQQINLLDLFKKPKK